ncbi:MAG: glucose-6-phosphate isomerase, partial [Gammaproteobacteria bacterium]
MPATTRPGPRTPVWTDLSAHATRLAAVPVQELFERDPKRFERLSREQSGLLMDFSRQRLDEIALAKLFQLADVIGLRARIDAMWQGAHINTTEDRAVLHVALRQPHGAGVGGADIERAVMAERARMLDVARAVRVGAIQDSAGKPFRLVVNIGIGGSDLGPAMAVQALSAFSLGAPRCEFVSNIDGVHLAEVLQDTDPSTTLFIVSSKTFTTLE